MTGPSSDTGSFVNTVNNMDSHKHQQEIEAHGKCENRNIRLREEVCRKSCKTKHNRSKHNYLPVSIIYSDFQRRFYSSLLIICRLWSSVQRKLSNYQLCPFLPLIRIMLVVELIKLLTQDNCLCTTLYSCCGFRGDNDWPFLKRLLHQNYVLRLRTELSLVFLCH